MIVCAMIPSNMTGLPFHSCQEFTTPWMSSAVLILVWATWCAQLWVLKFSLCFFSSRSVVSVSEMSCIGTAQWSPWGSMMCPLGCEREITTECWQICYFKNLCAFFKKLNLEKWPCCSFMNSSRSEASNYSNTCCIVEPSFAASKLVCYKFPPRWEGDGFGVASCSANRGQKAFMFQFCGKHDAF